MFLPVQLIRQITTGIQKIFIKYQNNMTILVSVSIAIIA
jgi:hypothetical protein